MSAEEVKDMSVEKNDQMTDEQEVERAQAAVRMELEKRRLLGQPIAYFDDQRNKIICEYPDGRIEEVDKASEVLAHG